MPRARSVGILPVFVLPAIVIAAIVCAGVFNWTHRTRADNQVVVRGKLLEWSEIRLRHNGRTPRFRITGNSSDFRIDPSVFRDVMKGKIPVGLVPGVQVEITADAAQVASPLRPPLDPSASVIWVSGLAVDGHRQFDVADVVKQETHNYIWLFPLFGMLLAFCCYVTFLWRRRSTPKSSTM